MGQGPRGGRPSPNQSVELCALRLRQLHHVRVALAHGPPPGWWLYRSPQDTTRPTFTQFTRATLLVACSARCLPYFLISTPPRVGSSVTEKPNKAGGYF